MTATQPTTLEGWLHRLELMQPDYIELGLSRILQVAARAGLDAPDFKVVTVAGTNGKGSTVAYIAGLLSSQNLSVGVYTSPHFIDFNERIVVDGKRASGAELCQAFALVDRVRGDIELTYFEFTTLAAIYCFTQSRVDVAVMEIGLGGRLDAVNAWDSDIACVTSVGIDHVDWLGDDREKIGFEKASVGRAGRALICGDASPPASVAATAAEIGALLRQIGRDFTYQQQADQWEYSDADVSLSLPAPSIAGEWAMGNASVAIRATRELLGFHVSENDIGRVLQGVSIAGRMQLLDCESVPLILDVAHNADAARLLAQYLQAQPVHGKTTAVFSCMQDKDIDAILAELSICIDCWSIAELDFPRAIELPQLTAALASVNAKAVDVFATVTTAFEQAVAQSESKDRIVVFGSFHVVGPVLGWLAEKQRPT